VHVFEGISRRGLVLVFAGGWLLLPSSYVAAAPFIVLRAAFRPRSFAHAVSRDFRRLNAFWRDFFRYD
jgi:hypothetical protein